MTNTQNIVLIGSGHLLSILAENARLEQQVIELRRELSECKAAFLLHVPFPLPIDEWARGPKLDNKKEKKNEQND